MGDFNRFIMQAQKRIAEAKQRRKQLDNTETITIKRVK